MEPLKKLEIITPNIQEKLKDTSKYNIISNLNQPFNIILNNLSSSIEINASYQDNIELNIFSKKYSLKDLKEIKYLSILDTIDEMYKQIALELSKNNSIIIEKSEQIYIKIPIDNIKFKELSFILNKRLKTTIEFYQDLYKLVSNLEKQIKNEEKENYEKINFCHKEIENLRQLVANLNDNNKNLVEKINLYQKENENYRQMVINLNESNKNLVQKINSLEKEISNLKKDYKVLGEQNQNKEISNLKKDYKVLGEQNQNKSNLKKEDKILDEQNQNLEIPNFKKDYKILEELNQNLERKNKNDLQKAYNLLEDKYEEIYNPWTTDKDSQSGKFEYNLKFEEDNFAKRDKDGLNIIKSKHKFINNKIYKLKYNITFKSGDFRVGFGNYCKSYYRLKDKYSVGLTNEGLFIKGINYEDIKLETNNKEILFIINLKESPNNFELFIDGKFYGKFNFNLDIIYGIAAFSHGNITIQTLRSSF